MVRLTITSAILKAFEYIDEVGENTQLGEGKDLIYEGTPTIGAPISHTKVLDISKRLSEIAEKQSDGSSQRMPLYHLDDLLRGSRLYMEPTTPKAEPVCLRPSQCTQSD